MWPTPKQPGQKTSIRHFGITGQSYWPGRRESGKARQTSTQCIPHCAALWPGSVTSSARGAALLTQQLPSCSRFCGWDGALSRRFISPPTVARRSTSWQWRRRRWAFGWIRLPFCGPTAVHTGTYPRVRFSGKPSGRFSFLASWMGGHSGVGTCWSSWFREAFGPRSGLLGSGERTTAGASYATMAQAPCSTAATSARPCRQRDVDYAFCYPVNRSFTVCHPLTLLGLRALKRSFQ